ncbi:MAG: GNAT family N-acetyltransferase [Pseudomonadota bacterium]
MNKTPDLEIVPYSGEFRTACLAVFDSNLGRFFAEYERQLFADFLDKHTDTLPYFVVLDDGVVVACGGYGKEGERVSLNWGMVLRDRHRTGLGSVLTRFRISQSAEVYPGVPVEIETSQHTMGFYLRHGFQLLKHVADGFAPGIDKVHMRHEQGASELT